MLPTFDALRRGLDRSVVYDRVMRVPIVAYSCFVLGRDVLGLFQQIAHTPAMFEQPDAGVLIALLARVSQWVTVALLAALPIIRLRPVAKSDEILPRIGAFVAVCLPPAFMLLDRAEPSMAFNLLSLAGSLASNVMAIFTLSFLGRSLSVMPEARRLVTGGPYGLVRHPLYLCEIVGFLGIALQYRSAAVVLLLALAVALQIVRARWEESVLNRAFPDYAAYRARTPFLMPRNLGAWLNVFVADSVARARSATILASVVMLLLLVTVVLPRAVG
jgi:protein-S-isoprenylcysteine O-methyltransferase Ste14